MHKQSALAQYCESNVLEIPNNLFGIRDVEPMLFNGDSSIFHKDLERDLINIEFHTRAPCIIYVETGKEIITTCLNKSFEVGPGEAIFLPKGLNLHSDYFHTGSGLHAYLLFFGSNVLSRFLAAGSAPSTAISNEEAILKLDVDYAIKQYFASLHSVYEYLNNSQLLLETKLLELLYLFGMHDDESLRRSILAAQRGNTKRNIKRLMDQYSVSGMSARELAELSGRSVSSFNREFKILYGVTPKQWLIEQRLTRAHSLLSTDKWSVTNAAMAVGYSNVSHFIAAFKKMYGITPLQVRINE